jgi:hypothetical protein
LCVGFTEYFQHTSPLATARKNGRRLISRTSRKILSSDDLRASPGYGNKTHDLFLPTRTTVSSMVTLSAQTILSPAMIAYALGARTVRGNSTSSRTPPLGAALPRHTSLCTWHQRARQRIPGILHLAQRKCWRSALGDPQTLAAPVAGIAGNAFCSHSKKCEVSKNDTYAAGAGDSNYADRWLASVWFAICPTSQLIRVSAQGTRR